MTRSLEAAVVVGLVLPLLATPAWGQDPMPTPVAQWDPTTVDTTPIDRESPPALAPVAIPSGGARMNGQFYLADGPGPNATIVFLPGFPGYETNADLAQAVRRAGYNALMVRYRGTWGSGGEFSWDNAVEDALAAIDFVGSDEAVARYRTDPERIHLVGDGFGGWTGLMAAAERPVVECVGTLGAWAPGVTGRRLAGGEADAAEWRTTALAAADPAGGPIRAASPEALVRELIENPDRYDFERASEGGRENSVLLITSSRAEADPARQTMMVAVRLASAGAAGVERIILDDDDAFSSGRIRVARSLVTWLERRCPAW